MNMKIKVRLTQSQIRDAAMRREGIAPERLALKPGIRVEKNRKTEARNGTAKHKKGVYAY